MRRVFLLATAFIAVFAAPAAAGTPFTVGEGKDPHLVLGADDVAQITWHDETRIFHCRLPRGDADCQPLNTIDPGTTTDETFLIGAGGAGLYLVMPHYVDEKTYLWQSNDNGATWGPRSTIYAWGGGTGPTEPVVSTQSGRVEFAATNPEGTTWSAKLDGSQSGTTNRANHGRDRFDFQIAPTGDGGLVGVFNDLQTPSFVRMAPGGDPSDQAAWSGPTAIGGIGDSTRVAGGPGGTYMLATSGPTDANQYIRKWNGTGFGEPVRFQESGYINDIVVGPSGAVGAIWRLNEPNGGNQLRLALSTDNGATFTLSTIAIDGSAIMDDMDLVLAQDTVGLAVYEGADGSNGARSLIRAVNTNPVQTGIVSPNPPSIAVKKAAVPGATLRLLAPGNCLQPGEKFGASLTAKKKKGKKGRRFRKVKRVVFSIGAVKLKKDAKKPFSATLQFPTFAPPGEKYDLIARVAVALRGGKTTSKVVSAKLTTCS